MIGMCVYKFIRVDFFYVGQVKRGVNVQQFVRLYNIYLGHLSLQGCERDNPGRIYKRET